MASTELGGFRKPAAVAVHIRIVPYSQETTYVDSVSDRMSHDPDLVYVPGPHPFTLRGAYKHSNARALRKGEAS